MKLNKIKPSNSIEDKRLTQPSFSWAKQDKEPIRNIHGINRNIKEDPEMVKNRLDISEAYQGALKGKKDRDVSGEIKSITDVVERLRKQKKL